MAQPVEDIENHGKDLDDVPEPDPVGFWERKQRELVTSQIDYNLESVAQLVRDKVIDLSPKYQRRFRWDPVRQSRLIESFLMNTPVPPVFLNEDEYGKYSVIDGKQRLNAIYEFMQGRLKLDGLKVFSDVNGLTYDKLPAPLQTHARLRASIRAIIILRQSDQDIKIDVFQRLNTGGVPANAQEIRNSAYPGPLNNLILELSEDKRFHRLLGVRDKDASTIYREMRDAEFVLRFFTFKDQWQTFTSAMARAMDQYMVDHKNAGEAEIKSLRESFNSTLDVVEAAFGDHAFQRWQTTDGKWRGQVLAALFDAEMFAAQGLDASKIAARRADVDAAMKALFDDRDFDKWIRSGTNTPAFFKARIGKVRGILEDAAAG